MRSSHGLPSPLLLGGIILIAIAGLLGYGADGRFMAVRGPSTLERMAGVDTDLAPHSPLQTELVPNLRYSVAFPEDLTVTATHDFEVTAVVLSTRRYHRSRAAWLSPIDLALAWEPLSNPVALSHLRLKQSHRVAQFRFGDEIGIDPDSVTATRRRLFGMLAADKVPFFGFDMTFPAAGLVEPKGDGLRYVPVSSQMMG